MRVGIVRLAQLRRNRIPAAIAIRPGHGVINIVVVVGLFFVPRNVAAQRHTAGKAVVEHCGDHFAVLISCFFLHEAGQRNDLCQRHIQFIHACIHFSSDLIVEFAVYLGNHVVHGVSHKEFIGVREQIPLRFHELVGLFLALGPEAELGKISIVGHVQKFLCGTQTRLLHNLCVLDHRFSLRECDPNRLSVICSDLQCGDDLIIAHIGGQFKRTVLQCIRRTVLAAYIKTEHLRRANYPRILQLLADGQRAGPLFNGDALCDSRTA